MRITIESDAALTTINEHEWNEGKMDTLIALAESVQSGEDLEDVIRCGDQK